MSSRNTRKIVRKRATKKLVVTEFDPAEFLDSDEMIAGYLTHAMEDPNPDVFLSALSDVARAKGMTAIAEKTGLGRESLYKALRPGAAPRYETVRKVLDALGVKLEVAA
jgi:probable addiction module antidote protein